MNEHGLPDLPPDVAALLHDARGALPAAPSHARRRVATRLAVSIGVVVPSATLAGSRLIGRAWLAKALGAASVVALVGGLTGALTHRASPRAASPHAHAQPSTRQPSRVTERDDRVAPPPEVRAAIVPVPSSAPPPASGLATVARERPAASTDDRSFQDELGLLNRALSSLGRGDLTGADATLSQHARRFPRGRLAPEREALRVRCAFATGDTAAAEAARHRFHRRYPNSVLSAEVDRLGSPDRSSRSPDQ